MSGILISEMIRSGGVAGFGYRVAPVFCHAHGVAFALEKMRQELTHAEFVVHNEKVGHKAFRLTGMFRGGVAILRRHR